MKKLIVTKTVVKDGHHQFTYEDGVKESIQDDGVVYAYKSKNGMLKATDYPDRAGSVDGKFVVTDEIKQIMGKPAIDNVPYDVWGIGEDYVIVSATGDKFYISGNIKHPNQDAKMKAYKIIHEICSMLK